MENDFVLYRGGLIYSLVEFSPDGRVVSILTLRQVPESVRGAVNGTERRTLNNESGEGVSE
jgi:hypothetical protein